jgi:two-component system, LytTR family, response regulator
MLLSHKTELIINRQPLSRNDIICLKADGNYSEIYFDDGCKTLLALCLKKLENRLTEPNNYFRIHKSMVVNLDHVKDVVWDRDYPFLVLSNNYKVAIARRKKDELRRLLLGFPQQQGNLTRSLDKVSLALNL